MRIYFLLLLITTTIPASVILIKQGLIYLRRNSPVKCSLKTAFDVPSLFNQSLNVHQTQLHWNAARAEEGMYSLESFFQNILGEQNIFTSNANQNLETKKTFSQTSITKRMTVVNTY